MEPDYDFLWIYDGDNVYAPKIGRWNTQSPETVTASGNVMCIEFRSDCGITAAGWEASWKALVPSVPTPEEEIADGVFPNPVRDGFTIRTSEMGFIDVAVYDIVGNCVLPLVRFETTVNIDASAWPAGVYVVNYGSPGVMGKVVKLVKL